MTSRAQWIDDHSVPVTILRFIKGDGLHMEFQPIADLSSGRIVGVEALARFSSEPPLGPERWFERADELGLRSELECRAIDLAIEQLSMIPADAYVTLNCSPGVACSGILDRLLGGLPLDRVVVEITEGEKVEDYASLNDALARLRARGLRVAIDDAGAGFAGIAHLIELRPDIIKLDAELTRNVDSDQHRKALVRSLTDYAAAVGASIVAEGIETKNELRALQRLGVHFGQGYLVGRPAPLPGGELRRARVATRRFGRARRGSTIRRVMIGVAAALVLSLPTAALASGAMPGSPLYPIKLSIERVRLVLAGGPADQAHLHAEFAHRRAAELAYVLSTTSGVEQASYVLASLRANATDALHDAALAGGGALDGVRAAVQRDLQSANYSLNHACNGHAASCAPARKSIDDLILLAAPPATHPNNGHAKDSTHAAQPASEKPHASTKTHPTRPGLAKTPSGNTGGKGHHSKPQH